MGNEFIGKCCIGIISSCAFLALSQGSLLAGQSDGRKAILAITDVKERCDAVKVLNDRNTLKWVAINDYNVRVRRVAVANLKDQTELFEFALYDPDEKIRTSAAKRLTEKALLERLALESRCDKTAAVVIPRITDQRVLKDLALLKSDSAFLAALRNVRDDEFLSYFALHCSTAVAMDAAWASIQSQEFMLDLVFTKQQYSDASLRGIRFLTDENRLKALLMKGDYGYGDALGIKSEALMVDFMLKYPGHPIKFEMQQKIKSPKLLLKLALAYPNYALLKLIKDPQALATVAIDCPDEYSGSVVPRIDNQQLLMKIAIMATASRSRYDAAERLRHEPTLIKVVSNDPDELVRIAAARRITDQTALKHLLNREKSEAVIGALLENVRDPVLCARHALPNNPKTIRCAAIKGVLSQQVLLDYAMLDKEPSVRRKAASHLTNPGLVEKLIRTCKDHGVRIAATPNLADKALIKWVFGNDPNAMVRLLAAKALGNREYINKWALGNSDKEMIESLAEEGLLDQSTLGEIAIAEEDWMRTSVGTDPYVVKWITSKETLAKVALNALTPAARQVATGRISDQTVLKAIALKDSDSKVRQTARYNLTEQKALLEIAKGAYSNAPNQAAHQMTSQEGLAKLILQLNDSTATSVAMGKLTDQTLLQTIALKHHDDTIISHALREITNQKFLADYVLKTADSYLASCGAERITAEDELFRVWKGSKFRRVRYRMVERMADQAALETVALTETDKSTREVSVGKLKSQDVLLRVAEEDAYFSVRIKAFESLEDQSDVYRVLRKEKEGYVRERCIPLLTNERLLKSVLRSRHSKLRVVATNQLRNQRLLGALATDSSEEVRVAAILRLNGASRLRQLQRSAIWTARKAITTRLLVLAALEKRWNASDTKMIQALLIGEDDHAEAAPQLVHLVRNVTDQNVLTDLVVNSHYTIIRRVAMARLTDPEQKAKALIEMGDDTDNLSRHFLAYSLRNQPKLLNRVMDQCKSKYVRSSVDSVLKSRKKYPMLNLDDLKNPVEGYSR